MTALHGQEALDRLTPRACVRFLYSGGSIAPIAFPGSTGTLATAINNSGQIIGEYDNHSFLYSNGSYTTIAPPGSSASNVSFCRQLT